MNRRDPSGRVSMAAVAAVVVVVAIAALVTVELLYHPIRNYRVGARASTAVMNATSAFTTHTKDPPQGTPAGQIPYLLRYPVSYVLAWSAPQPNDPARNRDLLPKRWRAKTQAYIDALDSGVGEFQNEEGGAETEDVDVFYFQEWIAGGTVGAMHVDLRPVGSRMYLPLDLSRKVYAQANEKSLAPERDDWLRLLAFVVAEWNHIPGYGIPGKRSEAAAQVEFQKFVDHLEWAYAEDDPRVSEAMLDEIGDYNHGRR